METYSSDIDSYIEECFRKKCYLTTYGIALFEDWKQQKREYINYTKTTVYEFMNYSMHDESHSINILENIELLLGRERVDKLSRSDLWLILNVAYAHDIGMTAEYEELEALWSEPEFQDYLHKIEKSYDIDNIKAVKNYFYFDKLLKQGEMKYRYVIDEEAEEEIKYQGKSYDTWPLELRKDITLLMSSYLRKNHSKRSEAFFSKSCDSEQALGYDRLYKMIGRLSGLHMKEFSDILEKEKKEAIGFGTDIIHPRFIAILLRVGDLLDLDNNRFDIFSLKHFGPLPDISVQNYQKHKSITHLMISPVKIEVTAESDNFKVCRVLYSWFNQLENEIRNLIIYWEEIAPQKLNGCFMGLPVLQIKRGKYKFEKNHIKEFKFDKQKLLDLFIGNNLYSTKLEFIREYIQNALDANRIQLWYEIEKLTIQKSLYVKDPSKEVDKLTPFDLKKQAYDAFPVYIRIKEYKEDFNKFILEIEDEGIGIDEEGVEAIANIGVGWRRRETYTKDIHKMRRWFRPTGGFGIGIQSAFMVTDKVVIYSKSTYTYGYHITIFKASDINSINDILVEADYNVLNRGTKVSLVIDFNVFMEEKIRDANYLKVNFNKDEDYFDYNDKLLYIRNVIEKYLKWQFPNSFMPIKLIVKPYKEEKVIQSKYFFKTQEAKIFEIPDLKPFVNSTEFYINLDNEEVIYDFDKETKELRLWNNIYGVFIYFSLAKETEKIRYISANYKNVKVKDNCKETEYNSLEYPFEFNILFDIMGTKVSQCLVVSRNKFLSEIEIGKGVYFSSYLKKILQFYIELLIEEWKDGENKGKKTANQIFYILLLGKCMGLLLKNRLQYIKAEWKNITIYANTFTINTLKIKYNKREENEKKENKLTNTEGEKVIEQEEKLEESFIKQNEFLDCLEDGNYTIAIPIGAMKQKEKKLKEELQQEELEKEELQQEEYQNFILLMDEKASAIIESELKSDYTKIVDCKNNNIIYKQKCKIIIEGITKEKEKKSTKKGETTKEEINEKFKRKERYFTQEELEGKRKRLVTILNVTSVPFKDLKNRNNHYVVINPYSKNTAQKVMELKKFGINLQSFIDIVIQDETYLDLVRWVWEHQRIQEEEKRYTQEDIDEAYREYMELDYYETFFPSDKKGEKS